MKCINCNTDNNLKDRTANNGNCRICGHTFVFEPTTMGKVKITDPLFAKVIAEISQQNSLFFTKKQLFYYLDFRNKKRTHNLSLISLLFGLGFFYLFFLFWINGFVGGLLSMALGWDNPYIFITIIYNFIVIILLYKKLRVTNKEIKNTGNILKILGGFILIAGIYFSVTVYNSFFTYAASVILGMLSIYLGFKKSKLQGKILPSFLITEYQIQDWLNRWQTINGKIDKILPSPQVETPIVDINQEITNYSFDRVVVCDTAAIAQFLIANNFHFENNCAILSITGYPERIFATVLEMLRRNTDLKVYSIHDASPRGVNLVNLLNSPNLFGNINATIIDIGLLPRQVLKKPNLFINQSPESAQAAKQLPPQVRATLSPEELEWLDNGYFVELESLPPVKLIQILTRGIALSRNSEEDILVPLTTDTAYIYAVDTFG